MMPMTETAPPEDDSNCPSAVFKARPEEIERQWFEQVYRGRGDSMAQLTWRAVIMGSLLGSVLSLTNLYIGLKSGWGFGVAITACILLVRPLDQPLSDRTGRLADDDLGKQLHAVERPVRPAIRRAERSSRHLRLT